MTNEKKALYVYLTAEEHAYIDELKRKTQLSKSEIISLLILKAKREIEHTDLLDFYDQLLLKKAM